MEKCDMNISGNFFCFNKHYVFSCKDNCIYNVNTDVFKQISNNTFDSSKLKTQDFYNYSYILDINTCKLPDFPHNNLKITFANSNVCNLKCSYCHSSMRNDYNVLKEDDFIKIMDYIVNIYRPNAKGYIVSINLSGEPLLNDNILNLMIKIKERYSKKLGENNKWIFTCFITNGTILTNHQIELIKELKITEQTISIDGPENVHNHNRMYKNGTGSFKDVLNNVRKLQKENIKVNASCVITPYCTDIYRIIMFFLEENFSSVSFQLVRPPAPEVFSFTKINELFQSFDKLFCRIFDDLCKGDFSLLLLLKKTLIFTPIRNIMFNNYYVTRCEWGNNIVIDNKGDLYPCLGFIGNQQFCFGNYKDNIEYEKISNIKYVDDLSECKKCWAKYLCGGACHFYSYSDQKDINSKSEIECLYRKGLIERSLSLYTKLYEKNLIASIREHLI